MTDVIPAEIRPIFWDVDPDGVDLAINAEFVIARILESTTPPALEWLEKHYAAHARAATPLGIFSVAKLPRSKCDAEAAGRLHRGRAI